MQGVYEAGYVEAWQDGEDLVVRARFYLMELEALGYYVLVGDHDLLQSACFPSSVTDTAYSFREASSSTAEAQKST